jgi:multidrug efflux pump subunit AcrB
VSKWYWRSQKSPCRSSAQRLLPVVVFLPLTLLTGVTGSFFRSLALTMAVALLTSLVLALSFTPVLAERFVKAKIREGWKEEADGRRDQPLAIAVISGLAVALLLSLIVTPTVYTLIRRKRA